MGAAVPLLPAPEKSSGLDVMLRFWVQATQNSQEFYQTDTYGSACPEDANSLEALWGCSEQGPV